MPISKQATKKLRHDTVRTAQNAKVRANVAKLVKFARKSPGAKTLNAAYGALDGAVKLHIVHKNTAARTKSRLAKLLKK